MMLDANDDGLPPAFQAEISPGRGPRRVDEVEAVAAPDEVSSWTRRIRNA